MASIDCVVDTHPMAREIDSVTNHIQGTTAAVVGMKVAVVKAEEEASQYVCENVNRGFYTLIQSQISQKIAKLQSEVDSHLMQLNQQRKQLLAIKGRMERDYNMISNRYLKLFTGLNQNLQQRVYELDKPVMEFAVKEVDKVSNRTKFLTAVVPVTQIESVGMSQQILASNLKFRGAGVIKAMSRFLSDMSAQNELTKHVLLPASVGGESQTLSVPVLIYETQYDNSNNRRTDVVVTDQGLSRSSGQTIQNAISERAATFEWESGKGIDNEVRSEFDRFLSNSNASARVKDMAARLFLSNNYQTLKGS